MTIEDVKLPASKHLIELETYEYSVEATTSVHHNGTDVEEGEKVDLKVTEEEDISEATKEIEKLHTFDRKEIKEKSDELKSKEAIVAQNKQRAEYETEIPTLSELSSDEEKEKAITKPTGRFQEYPKF